MAEATQPVKVRVVRREGRQPQRTATVWEMNGRYRVQCKPCQWVDHELFEDKRKAFALQDMHEIVRHTA